MDMCQFSQIYFNCKMKNQRQLINVYPLTPTVSKLSKSNKELKNTNIVLRMQLKSDKYKQKKINQPRQEDVNKIVGVA